MRQLKRRHIQFLVICSAVIALKTGVGQTPQATTSTTKPPIFEVATIKPGKNLPGHGSGWFPGGRFTTRDTSLKDLIRLAYDPVWSSTLPVLGGPKWLDTAHFDIEAKAEEPVPPEWAKIPGDQRNRMMLQALLADRFKLKLHHETRDLPVYVLTVVTSGPKMKPSAMKPPPSPEEAPAAAFGSRLPAPRNDGNWRGIRALGARTMLSGSIVAQHELMNLFVTFLQIFPEVDGRQVIDKTGLTGEYDFTLQWTPIQMPEGAPPADPSWPSLFTALQEQLGLKLEATKAPGDVIVVDSAEMPTQN